MRADAGCRAAARSTLGDQSQLQQRDAPALAVMRELAGQYPRYGLPEDPDLSRARSAKTATTSPPASPLGAGPG